MPTIRPRLALWILVALAANALAAPAAEPVYDVVVYGGTPGGVTAAVAAARHGADVLLLEQKRHVGGLTTSGLCNDEVHHMAAWTITGLPLVFYRRLAREGGRPDPQEVWRKGAMNTWHSSVAQRVRARTVDEDGHLRPGISAWADDLTPGAGDRKVQNCNFRLTLAKDRDKRVPFPKPQRYAPGRYALLADYLKQHPDTRLKEIVAYWHIGGGKFEANNHHVQRVAVSRDEFTNEGRLWLPGEVYEIPYRAIIPKPDQCDNLLVPVASSFSHVAFCTYRLEPTWMGTGHAAGVEQRSGAGDRR